MSKSMTLKELFSELERQGFHITNKSEGWQVFNPATPDSGLVTIHASSIGADANRGYANTLADLKRIGFSIPGANAKKGHGEYKCPDCDRTFKQAHALGAHRYRAHGYRSPNYAKDKSVRESKRKAEKAPEVPAPAKQPAKQETPYARAMALETALSSALEQVSASAHELVLIVEGTRTLHAGFEKLREEHKVLQGKHDALVKRLEVVIEDL